MSVDDISVDIFLIDDGLLVAHPVNKLFVERRVSSIGPEHACKVAIGLVPRLYASSIVDDLRVGSRF